MPEGGIDRRQVPAALAEDVGELAERVVGAAWRCRHLRDAVDGHVVGLDRPAQVVGRDPALPQRMRQPDARHVDGLEQAVRARLEDLGCDEVVDLAGIDVGLARQLGPGKCSGLARHRGIIHP